MAIILDIDHRQGSLLDKKAHTVTPTAVTLVDKEKGMAAQFNGTSSVLTIADSDDLSFGDGAGNDRPFSIECWVRFSSKIGNDTIVSKQNEYSILWTGTTFYFSVFSYNNPTIKLTRWYSTATNNGISHIIVTYDGSKLNTGLKIYINRIRVDNQNDSSGTYLGMPNTTNPLLIGNTSFSDAITLSRLYNTELTQIEIDNRYTKFLTSVPIKKQTSGWIKPKPTSLNENGLVAAYNMTIQKGKVYDISGNGKHLTTITKALSTNDGIRIKQGILSGPATFLQPKTVNIRFKVLSSDSAGLLISGLRWTGIYTNSIYINGTELYVSYNGDASSTYGNANAIVVGVWTNLTITFDGVSVFKFYVNGSEISITNGTANYYAGYNLAFGDRTTAGGNYLDCEIADCRIYNRVLTTSEIVKYNKSQTRLTLNENFANNGADGVVKPPKEWINGTTTGSIREQTTYVNQSIKIGTKYLKFIGNGTMIRPINLGSITNNGYISYWYYNGVSWVERKGWVNAPVSGVSYASGKLTFTGSANHGIANIKIWDGIKI